VPLHSLAPFVKERSKVSHPSALDHVIAGRMPPENEIPFLRASCSLTRGTIMDMDVRGAIRNGVVHRHVTLKSLVQIPSLSSIDGNPTAVLGLSGIDVIAWQRSESSVNGMNLVLILLAGLPGPTHERRRRTPCLWVMTE